MTIEIVEINEAKALENKHMGIRFDDHDYKMGEDVANSYDWNNDEELDGTCALQFGEGWPFDDVEELKESASEMIENVESYSGNNVYLIAGIRSRIGEDDNEVIISGAEVIGILKITK